MTISNLMKMAESYQKGYETLWEKDKCLIVSNFSFSLSVFKRHVRQTYKNQGLFGKGLKAFADNILHVSQMIGVVSQSLEILFEMEKKLFKSANKFTHNGF